MEISANEVETRLLLSYLSYNFCSTLPYCPSFQNVQVKPFIFHTDNGVSERACHGGLATLVDYS